MPIRHAPRALAALALLLGLVTGPAHAQSVTGKYRVEGTNLDGSPYKGTAEIRAASDTSCVIRWRTGGGNSVQEGICMRSGNTIAAAYTFSNGLPGLVIYRIGPDGTLDGVWTVAGQSGSGRDVLIPAR
jgi:hypothetical protein